MDTAANTPLPGSHGPNGAGRSRKPRPSPADFGAFLFAPVWAEPDGTILTALSALARLGIDPWDEASRLAGMAHVDAANCLARSLTLLLGVPWSLGRARRIAIPLVALLPGDGGPAPALSAHPGPTSRVAIRHRVIVLMMTCVAAGLALLLAGQWAAGHHTGAVTDPPLNIAAGRH